MNADLPSLEEARAARAYIERVLSEPFVASAVMVLVLEDGAVVEVTVPTATGVAWIEGHTGRAVPPWVWALPGDLPMAAAFTPRGNGPVRVRLVRGPAGRGGPVRLSEAVRGLVESYAAQSAALGDALAKVVTDDEEGP